MDLVKLRRGEGEVVLAPHVGGGILSWTDRGQAMLRPPLPGALELGLVRNLAAMPLVPYSNRIDRGLFGFAGTRYELPATFGGHAIHGVGWKRPWTVTRSSDDTATLRLDHAPDELWPFAFQAEQEVTLGEASLTWRLSMTSHHDGPAPAGLGFHPYFPRGGDAVARGAGASLRFAADGVWLNGPDSIPMRRAPVPDEWDHAGGKRVGATVVDNCFTGWRGPALLDYATHTLAITADPLFRFLVAFTPEDKDFFAVEPVSHMNDGVNRMDADVDHGVVTLQGGETLAGAMRMDVHWP
jgi:aldose 1-epimerase